MWSNHSNCCSRDGLHGLEYYLPTVLQSTIILTVLGLVLFVGIVGNILVLIIIAAVKSMHTVVNRCLFAMALTDLVSLVIFPIRLITGFAHHRIPLGLQFCQFLKMFEPGAIYSSIFIFFYVTVDRYFAICHPLKSRRFLGRSKIHVILVVIWVISLGLSYPYVHQTVYEQYVENDTGVKTYSCYVSRAESWFVLYDTIFVSLTVYLPIPAFVVMYARMIKEMNGKVNNSISISKPHGSVSRDKSRQRGVIMLLSNVIIFIFSQVPASVLLLVVYYNNSLLPQDTGDLFVLICICGMPLFIKSASNPVLYFTMSTKFRRGFLLVFCNCRQNVGGVAVNRDNRVSTLASTRPCEDTASTEIHETELYVNTI